VLISVLLIVGCLVCTVEAAYPCVKLHLLGDAFTVLMTVMLVMYLVSCNYTVSWVVCCIVCTVLYTRAVSLQRSLYEPGRRIESTL
jgi:membrane protein implicated in regulation of membrane protease activity